MKILNHLFNSKSKVAAASALKGQRLKRRRKKHADSFPSKSPLKKVLVTTITCCSIAGTIYLSLNAQRFFGLVIDRANSLLFLAPADWEVQLNDRTGNAVSEEVRKEIFGISSKYLKTEGASDLVGLSHAIEALGSLEQVTIVRPRYQSLIISVSQRKPILQVSVGSKMRLLTAEGVVFGDASQFDSFAGPKPSIVVNGIFDGRSTPIAQDKTMRVLTTTVEDGRLADAVEIFKIFAKSSIEMREMSFQNFRGYTLTLSDGTEVMLGARPFEYKLEKLTTILARLKVQGTTAARIELDYDGKAFIKERKL